MSQCLCHYYYNLYYNFVSRLYIYSKYGVFFVISPTRTTMENQSLLVFLTNSFQFIQKLIAIKTSMSRVRLSHRIHPLSEEGAYIITPIFITAIRHKKWDSPPNNISSFLLSKFGIFFMNNFS